MRPLATLGRKTGQMAFDTPNIGAPERMIPVQKDLFADRSKNSWGHCGAAIDLSPLQSEKGTGLFVTESWFAGDCMFSQRAIDGNTHRHEAKHIRDTGNIIYVYRYISGHVVGRADDEPYAVYPGMIAIRDYARPFEGLQMPGVAQGVFFPHEVLGLKPGANLREHIFAKTSNFARIMHAEFDSLFLQLGDGATHIPAHRTERLKNCVKFALFGDQAKADIRTQARYALKDIICAHIEENLTNAKFTTASLLRQFGVSRATLFRMFEPEGGVRSYINDRRLYRAVFQISMDPMTRGEISKASEMWGFSSDANFNRSVRRCFGVSPSSLFDAPLEPVAPPASSPSILQVHIERLMRRGQQKFLSTRYN